MKLPLATVCATFVVAGCATSERLTFLSNLQTLSITCNRPGNCYAKAASLCQPNGYEPIVEDHRLQAAIVPGPNGSVVAGYGEKVHLIVHCNGGPHRVI
jgi:hypothetical protein